MVLGIEPSGSARLGERRRGEIGSIIRQIAGRTLELDLTHKPVAGRGNVLQGGGGLRVRMGLAQADLVRDIRTIMAIHQRPNPVPELSFVDDVMPVTAESVTRDLLHELDRLLEPGGDPDGRLALGIPDRALAHLKDVQNFELRIDTVPVRRVDLTLADLTEDASLLRVRKPRERLMSGEIHLRESSRRNGILLRTRAFDWLEASVTVGDRHYALLEGDWFEFGHDYAHRVEREIAEVFGRSTLLLPGWREGWDEARYNKFVQRQDPRFTCFDRELLRDRTLHRGRGLEVCDLLGPANELVHVKRASGSSVLSHLFEQGLVSYQSLQGIPETRSGFRRLAADAGRELDPGWTPGNVVFAILLRNGRTLSPESLFPFARASLARAAAELRQERVRVDVIGIPAATDEDAA